MPDREKVMHDLECCALGNCDDCFRTDYRCTEHLCAAALTLLREQEAKAAWYDTDVNEIIQNWHCGHCGVIITHGDKYCRMCGREVKWEPPKEEDDAE